MPKPPTAQGEDRPMDTDADRHPTFVQALRRILQEAEIPDIAIERLEVFVHASGDVTYRMWAPRAEDSEGGYLPPA